MDVGASPHRSPIVGRAGRRRGSNQHALLGWLGRGPRAPLVFGLRCTGSAPALACALGRRLPAHRENGGSPLSAGVSLPKPAHRCTSYRFARWRSPRARPPKTRQAKALENGTRRTVNVERFF